MYRAILDVMNRRVGFQLAPLEVFLCGVGGSTVEGSVEVLGQHPQPPTYDCDLMSVGGARRNGWKTMYAESQQTDKGGA